MPKLFLQCIQENMFTMLDVKLGTKKSLTHTEAGITKKYKPWFMKNLG